MAVWSNIAGDRLSDAALEKVVIATILLVTVALLPVVSTAVLRLSLRLSPLTVARTVRFDALPILWLSWLLVFMLLVGSGSEQVTLVVSVVVLACGMGRVYYFRRRWRGFPRGRTVLFLRRFGKTADRLVSTAVRRAVPEGESATNELERWLAAIGARSDGECRPSAMKLVRRTNHVSGRIRARAQEKPMSHRGLVSAALPALVVAIRLVAEPVMAQAPQAKPFTPPPSTYSPPRTPWGDPDLMGVWDYQSVIRMERPKELAGKARFANEAEYEAWAKINAPNRETETGVGAYNEWWNSRNFVTNLNTSLIVDPPDGRYPPLTPEGERRRKEILAKASELASWEDYHALVRCIASQTPNAPQAYNSGTYIMQSPGWVAIIRERLDTRLIPLDGRAHIGDNIRHWNGDAVGRWEGNTLVVETTNFTDKQRLGGMSGASVPAGIPFGNFRLIEHFVPVSPNRIEYYATVIDPTTWTRPWTFNLPWQRDDDYTMFEYACHEGNYALPNSLRGERIQEAEAAKKREGGK